VKRTRSTKKPLRWDPVLAQQLADEIQGLLETGIPPNAWQSQGLEEFRRAFDARDMTRLQNAYESIRGTGWGQILLLT
jgi:hypothetical protein